jgi:hypothetical protein
MQYWVKGRCRQQDNSERDDPWMKPKARFRRPLSS